MALQRVNEKSLMLKHRMGRTSLQVSEFDSNHEENPDIDAENYAGLFGKGLIHDNTTKIPLANEITKLRLALISSQQEDFDALNRGGTRKLVNPQASLSHELSGCDPSGITMPACPVMDSAEAAGEMLEVYEKALLRDTPFSQIEANATPDVDRAVTSLNNYGSNFKGPKIGGNVTAQTLFRGGAVGTTIGPYLSQLLLRDIPMGAHTVVQKYNYEQGVYGVSEANWFEIQKGNVPVAQQANLAQTKYIYNGRSLGSFVHVDFVYQTYYQALAILFGASVELDPNLPALTNEDGFVTYGGPVEIASGVAEVARHAIKAAWVQKWRYNLRLRPETMAHRVASQDLDSNLTYVDPNIFVHGANTITAIKNYNLANGGEGKALLPLQFAEGSPTHPSYPAGHAVLSGACATYLKLMLNDQMPWSSLSGISTVVESTDGDSLTSYTGSTTGMTVGTELNKLAANIAIGRNIAGVHYRADGDDGMDLGEKVAIGFVKDMLSVSNESTPVLSLTKFDGSTITVS